MPRPQFNLKTMLLCATLLPLAFSLLFVGSSDWLAQLLYRSLGGAIIGFCIGSATQHRLLWSTIGLVIAYPPLACLAFMIFGAMQDTKWDE